MVQVEGVNVGNNLVQIVGKVYIGGGISVFHIWVKEMLKS